MISARDQLDRRFDALRPLLDRATRPSRGWVKAIREALGMTTAQLAQRMGVKQPRIVELEKSEPTGAITLQSLERAAEALGCRVVYVLLPERSLAATLRERAAAAAEAHLSAVDQTMRLEEQSVDDKGGRAKARQALITQLLMRPARLWDAP
jgi:predicted DNA-binding mobile mystery protein A